MCLGQGCCSFPQFSTLLFVVASLFIIDAQDNGIFFILLKMNMVDRNDIDDDLDEPMASQSVDAEAPLTHNSSKNNFFASPDEQPTAQVINTARGSFKNAVRLFFKYLFVFWF